MVPRRELEEFRELGMQHANVRYRRIGPSGPAQPEAGGKPTPRSISSGIIWIGTLGFAKPCHPKNLLDTSIKPIQKRGHGEWFLPGRARLGSLTILPATGRRIGMGMGVSKGVVGNRLGSAMRRFGLTKAAVTMLAFST